MAVRRDGSRIVAVMAATAVLVAGCGEDGAAPRTLRVFAAASLTEAFTDLADRFEATHVGVGVELTFAGSAALVRQILDGAEAKVVATADESTMASLVDRGRAGPPRTFARNRLAIVVERGNPAGVRRLADLAEPGLLVVLCAPEVPCGRYSAAALDRAGVALDPASLEQDVKAVVAKVSLGEADAGIVYHTDVEAAPDDVEGVPVDAALADDPTLQARYPIAVVEPAGNADGARAWVDFVLSGAGQAVLRQHGFLAP